MRAGLLIGMPGLHEQLETRLAAGSGEEKEFVLKALAEVGAGPLEPRLRAILSSPPDWLRDFTPLYGALSYSEDASLANLFRSSLAIPKEHQEVDFHNALRFTRSQAILHRKEQFLEVDLEHKTYLAPGRSAVELPESIELKLLTAQSEASSDKVGRIRFFSDGGSTGGRVTLISGEREWKVNVSWLTGEIELDDGRKERRS